MSYNKNDWNMRKTYDRYFNASEGKDAMAYLFALLCKADFAQFLYLSVFGDAEFHEKVKDLVVRTKLRKAASDNDFEAFCDTIQEAAETNEFSISVSAFLDDVERKLVAKLHVLQGPIDCKLIISFNGLFSEDECDEYMSAISAAAETLCQSQNQTE